MKKIIISVLIFVFAFGFAANAATADLPDVGLTPDSPFYFVKAWKESIQTFFTFGLENKAKQYLHLAEVRLAEYQKMVEKGKIEIAENTLKKYEGQLNRALDKVKELEDKGKDVKALSEKIEQDVSKHVEILQENLQKVPEQAKEGIENAIENSQKQIERIKGTLCKDSCGDGLCQQVVCLGTGCPCPEIKTSCPEDCATEEEPISSTSTKKSLRKSCQNLCGDGTCQEAVCDAVGCPCSETKESCPSDCGKTLPSQGKKSFPGGACKDMCGNGRCEEVVCLAIGCPCSETKESCPSDCAEWQKFTGIIERDKGTNYNPKGCGYCFTSDDGKYKCALLDTSKVGEINGYLGKKVIISGKKYEGAVPIICPIVLDVNKIEIK